jgi:hypothetical protein
VTNLSPARNKSLVRELIPVLRNEPDGSHTYTKHTTWRYTMTDEPSIWRERTKRLIDEAAGLVDTEEVGPLLSLAMKCEDIERGAADPDEVAGYSFPGEDDDESDCTCTPDQRATGGFKSTCPVHGVIGGKRCCV